MKAYRVYFGGSFYPPHLGHDEMLLALLAKPEVKAVHLVPTYQNPLKESSQILLRGAPVDKNKFIYQVMEAWMSSLKSRNVQGLEKIQIEWLELEQSKATYTFDTLSKLSEQYPDEPWALCVGDDCLDGLEKWKHIDALLEKIEEFWVFPRGKVEMSLIERVSPGLRSLCVWRVMTEKVMEVSSTEIRDFFEGADASRELLGKMLPEVATCFRR